MTLNRHAMETAVELRPPALERVFDKEFLGRKWKHVIEPKGSVSLCHWGEQFCQCMKFDERDILTDTHEVEYGFVTRLYAKRTSPKPEDCSNVMTALHGGRRCTAIDDSMAAYQSAGECPVPTRAAGA